MRDRKDELTNNLVKLEKQYDNVRQNANNRNRIGDKEIVNLKKQIASLEHEHQTYTKKMSLMYNPESKHKMMKELSALDEEIKEIMLKEKDLMEQVAINEIKFARQGKKQKVEKNSDDYNELTKD